MFITSFSLETPSTLESQGKGIEIKYLLLSIIYYVSNLFLHKICIAFWLIPVMLVSKTLKDEINVEVQELFGVICCSDDSQVDHKV